ncbi:MAG: hypothetical protein HJHJAOHD_02535 [Flavobacteriales bacterium]|nr:hypothetical protein [Flavobacteriales bacterium]
MKFFIVTYTGKPLGESGENCGTEYTFESACIVCGTGAKIHGHLKTKKISKIKKGLFQTVDGDNLISENLYSKLRKKKIQIDNLNKVIDSQNNKLPFYHLYSNYCFPKAIVTKGLLVENQCQTCKRNGYFNSIIIGNLERGIPTKVIPLKMVYGKLNLVFLNQSDFFNSWEHMGLSNRNPSGNTVIRYARPLLIVSERFKIALEEENIDNVKFDAITI